MSITDSLVATIGAYRGVSPSNAPTKRDMRRELAELAEQSLDYPAWMDPATIAMPDTNATIIAAALNAFS